MCRILFKVVSEDRNFSRWIRISQSKNCNAPNILNSANSILLPCSNSSRRSNFSRFSDQFAIRSSLPNLLH